MIITRPSFSNFFRNLLFTIATCIIAVALSFAVFAKSDYSNFSPMLATVNCAIIFFVSFFVDRKDKGVAIDIDKFERGKLFQWVVYIVAILAAGCTIFFAFDPYIWYDEAFSLRIVDYTWMEIINFSINDVHPPFYYFILKAWYIIFSFIDGDIYTRIFLGRILSIIPCALTILLMRKIKDELPKNWVWLTIIVFGAIYIFTKEATTIRMYTWAILFVSGVVIYAREIMMGRKGFVWLTVFTILSAYIHDMALISSFITWVVLLVILWKRERKRAFKLIICGIIVSVVFLPWLLILFRQIGYFNNLHESESVLRIFYAVFGVFFPMFFFLPILFGWLCYKYGKQHFETLFPFLVLIITFVVCIPLSGSKSLMLPRYYSAIGFGCWIAVLLMFKKINSVERVATVLLLFLSFVMTNGQLGQKVMKHMKCVKEREEFFASVPENAIFVFDGDEFHLRHSAGVLKVMYNREVFVYDKNVFATEDKKTGRDVLNINTATNEDEFWNLLSFIPGDVYLVETKGDMTLTIPDNYFKNEIGDFLLENEVKFYNLYR